ncbi:hypothetical protein ATCC90586_000998 [Pythium insidiosum]|nr:hypothetical protein ATCC90586_000998 [Pythium insidiosum]
MKTSALLLACATSWAIVQAKPDFVKRIPGAANVPDVKAIGHVDPAGGGERNAFGAAFLEAGKKWTPALCYADSDEDGQFNGAELGDPCCEWEQGKNEKLAYTTASAPGNKFSVNQPLMWKDLTCADGKDPETKRQAFLASASKTPKADNASSGSAAASVVPTATPKNSAIGHAIGVSTVALGALTAMALV